MIPQLEQRQFRDYADVVISEARARGGNTQVLEKAAMLGAGGGKGPAVTGLQPSYKVSVSMCASPGLSSSDITTGHRLHCCRAAQLPARVCSHSCQHSEENGLHVVASTTLFDTS